MLLNTTLDRKLKKYLIHCGVKNIDKVKAVHAFGYGFNYDINNMPSDKPRLIHHRIFSYDELKPEYNKFFREYHRILVVFINGGTIAWDFEPREWERINSLLY